MDAEPQVEYRGDVTGFQLTDVTGFGEQTLSGALAYRGPGWLPRNPNWYHLY